MSKKVTLGDALAQCDRFTMDDYDAEVVTYMKSTQGYSHVTIERADEEDFQFDTNQEADMSSGRAYFDDMDGEEHEFVFYVEHLLGER